MSAAVGARRVALSDSFRPAWRKCLESIAFGGDLQLLSDSDANAPRWTRTINPLIKSQLPPDLEPPAPQRLTTYQDSPCPSLAHQSTTADPDLALVVERWPSLSATLRARIVKLAAKGRS
jgi:hypothetical protein